MCKALALSGTMHLVGAGRPVGWWPSKWIKKCVSLCIMWCTGLSPSMRLDGLQELSFWLIGGVGGYSNSFFSFAAWMSHDVCYSDITTYMEKESFKWLKAAFLIIEAQCTYDVNMPEGANAYCCFKMLQESTWSHLILGPVKVSQSGWTVF